jgi:UDP-2,4-diacetamido-2,4,6-trideoxy-beta-L-altropyranose hydrolase
MKIGFFLNFEKSLGGGHFWRCFNLAKKMKKTGRKFYFFSNIKDKSFLALLKKNNFKYVEIFEKNNKKFIQELIEKIEYLKIKNLITDSYKVNYFEEKKIKTVVKKLVVINDHVNKKHFCDLFINNNFLSQKLKDIIKEKNPNINLAIGHRFTILPSSNSHYKNKKNNFNDIKNIFIFFGSSDNTDETYKIFKIVSFFPFLKFHIVIGNFNKNNIKFKRLKELNKNTKIYFNQKNENIMSLLRNSDLAIGAGGVNMIERLYLGLPSLVIGVATNQKNGIEYLRKKNFILYLGESKNVTSKKIQINLKKLIKNKEIFKKLQKNTHKASLHLNSDNLIIKKLNTVLTK